MNTLVSFYRQQFPDDKRSDEEVMGEYAQSYPQEELAKYPDFLADWQNLQQRQAVETSSIGQEFGRGVHRGVLGLESSAAGIGALGADVLGADKAKAYLLDVYKNKAQQIAQEAPPSVPTIQQAATSFPAAGQYIAGKAGELIPNVGEALGFAAAGTMVAPGPGTEAGAVAGLFGRAAAKSWLKKVLESTLTAAEKDQFTRYAAGEIAGDALMPAVSKVVKEAAGHLASVSVNAANFAALGAGGSYGELSGTPGVKPEDAKVGALIAGAGASIGALIPERLIKSLFGEKVATDATREWIDSKAVAVPKELLVAGSGMGAMEFFNILGEHYADPKKRDKDFTKEEWSRILNAAAVGVMAGTPAAAITGLRKTPETPTAEVGRPEPRPQTPAAAKDELTPLPPPAPEEPPMQPGPPSTPGPPEPPPPGMTPEEVANLYPKAPLQQQIETEVSNAIKTRQESVQQQRERDDAQLRQAEEDRKHATQDEEKGVEDRPGGSLQQAARELDPAVKANLEAQNVNVDALAAGAVEAASREAMPSPVDVALAKARSMALSNEAAKPKVKKPETITLYRAESPTVKFGDVFDAEKLKAFDVPGKSGIFWTSDPKYADYFRESYGKDAVVQEVTMPIEEAEKHRVSPIEFKIPEKEVAKSEEVKTQEEGDEGKGLLSPTPAAAPAVETGAAPPADWIAAVPESYSAWVEPVAGKEKTDFFRPKGFMAEGNNKESTNTRGVFQKPDGNIVVATIKKTRSKAGLVERVEQGTGKSAKSWDDLVKEGWKPIGYSRGGMESKVYREYSPAQWDEIKPQLEAKAQAGRAAVSEVAPTPEAQTIAAGLTTVQKEARLEGKATWVSRGNTEPIARELGWDLESAPKDRHSEVAQGLASALQSNPDVAKAVADIKESNLHAFYKALFRAYNDVHEAFQHDESLTQEQLRSRFVERVQELAKQHGTGEREGLADVASPGADVALPTEPSPSSDEGVGGSEHLAKTDIGRDQDVSPAFQGAVREILSNAKNAFDALVTLNQRGLFGDSPIVKDLIALGDHGTRLLIGGEHRGSDGRESAGRYDAMTHAANVYDVAFNDGTSLRTFLHEYVHGNTIFNMETGRNRGELTFLYEFAREEAAKQGTIDHYGLTNQAEFIAEAFSNPEFQNFLRSIKSTGVNKTMWTRFLEWVGKLIGIRDPTLLDDVIGVGNKLSGSYKPIRVQVPETAQTMQWHTPSIGSKDLAQTYNPVTGEIERAPLIQDSVEAAMLNIQRSDPLEFLLPAGTTVPLPQVDPSIRMNNEAGINNKIEETRSVAAQAGALTLRTFRTLFGLHNTETVRQRQINEAHVKGIQGFRPDQNINALRHEENVDYANVGAASALEREQATVGRAVTKAKEAEPRVKAVQQKLLTEHQEILDNFKDAEFMSGVIKRGVKKLLYEDIRDLERAGKAVGAAFQQYQDIEGKIGQPIDPVAVAAMRRLYTGDALQGEHLFEFLNEMANDPSIDFTRPASQIRAYIRHASDMDSSLQRYGQLAADTSDAKALLSTVIAFGKLNQRELAMLEARRMESGTDREALIQELKDQRKETNEQILTGIRSVAKASKLEEAAKLENRKALRLITRANRIVEHTDKVIASGEAAMPVYENEIQKLVAKIKQTEDAVFTDGMKIRVPVTMEAKPKWDERTLNFKATSGPVTTPEQLKASVGQMAAWMKLRETAAQNGDETAMGSDYQRVKRQVNEIVNNRLYDPMMRETDHTVTGLVLGADGKKVGALGTPSAGLIEQGMNKFAGDTTNYRNQSDKLFGYKNSRLLSNVQDVLNKGQSWWQRKKVTSEWFEKNMLNSVLGFLERGKPAEGVDRQAAADAWFAKLGPWLLSQDTIRPLIADRMPAFMKAMREYVDSAYHSGQWWVHKVEGTGLLVQDPKLGGQLRKHIPVGLWTFQRKFSDLYRNMIHTMRLAGWSKDEAAGIPGASEAWKNIGDLYVQDPAKAQALVAKYMTDTVEKDFVYKLTHVPDESVFHTPVLDDSGTTMAADSAEVAKAYDDAGGNLIEMFKRLHDAYNGQDAVGNYIQAGLQRLASVYHEVDNALRKVEPKGATQVADIEGMVPNAMIDARQFQHLPADWFDYHKFDRNDNARMAERVAWQSTFGRSGKAFAGWYQTAQDEAGALVAKLRDTLTQAERTVPIGNKKEIDASAVKILAADKSPMLAQFKTGADRLRYLRKVEERAPFLDTFLRNISTYFNRGNQEEGSLRWGIRLSGELASLLVNQPSSAIAQLATTLDIMAQWGLSPTTAKATARTIQMTAKDIGGSLAQGIGWEFLKASQYEKRFVEMNLNDPEVARRFGDIFTTLSGEEHNPAARFFRQAKDVQSATLNLVGEKAQYTPLRPLSPFFQTVVSANRGLFVALSEMADGYVTKGLEYLRANPGTKKLTSEMLKLKGQDKVSFEKWEADHRRYGLDFTEMAKGALDRLNTGDKTVLTNKELERIYSVGLNVISLESNIATMPLWAFNNSLVRFGLPLLGWSYRRALQVAGLRLNNQEQNSLKAASSAMLGMAAVGLGGLGLSLVVDAYSEDVLGKKRNLRGLRVPVSGNDWVGIQERINRIGTFGLWGEVLNSAVNVGTGQGDNRMLSVDQRVVAMQSFQSIQKAVSAFINQDFDADYQHVVRPMIAAVGGNGMLQYMQIFNHAFDIDNVENRVVRRINAENYLRVTGRDLGMSIRTGGGGYATPTPITPWIARMEYAAYANDPSEFKEMYQGALAEAKRAGKDNPTDYVKKAFETRHPLRYVFAQTPSERDYREILGNLDDQGQQSVTDAVRLFNYYGSHIGLAPFMGSSKKDAQRAANPAAAARAREMALGF